MEICFVYIVLKYSISFFFIKLKYPIYTSIGNIIDNN